MFNLYIHTEPRELVVMDRVLAKASRKIGKTADFLEADETNCRNIRDIWKARLMRNLDGLVEFDDSVVSMYGYHPGVIIANGLPNACAVFELLNTYSLRAARMRGMIDLITLNNKG